MRVGVLGPGVIGSVLGGRLAAEGHDVVMVGRGARLAQIHELGLEIVDDATGARSVGQVHATDDLRGEDPFDQLLVCVRADQATAALERVRDEDESENVVTMINHALGIDAWTDIVGPRLCFGFPGISGRIDDGRVHHRIAPRRAQPTSLGERDGRASERLLTLAQALEAAGVPSDIQANIDAWLRFHVAWIHVLGLGLANADFQLERLAQDGALRGRMVDAIREGFTVIEALGHPLTPPGLAWLRRIPRPVLALGLKLMSGTAEAHATFGDIGEGQRLEHVEMTRQMRALARQAGVEMPAHRALARAVLSVDPVDAAFGGEEPTP